MLNEQSKENNYISKYFESFIKYKFSKIRKNFDFGKYIEAKNNYDRRKANDLAKIVSKLRETMNISDFCDMTRDVWDQKFYDIIENLVNNLFKLLEITEFFIEKSEINLNKHKDSKSLTFKMLNFCILMMNIGCNFEVESKSYEKY